MNTSANFQTTNLNNVRSNRKTNTDSKKEIIKEIGEICQNKTSVKELTDINKQNILQNIDKLDQNYYDFCLFKKTHTESSVKVWVLIFAKFNNGNPPENLQELNTFILDFSNKTKYKIDNNSDWFRNSNTYFKNILDFCNKKLKSASHEDSNPYNSSYKEFNISAKSSDNQQTNEKDNNIDKDLQKQNHRSDSIPNKYSENSNMENINQQTNEKDNNVDKDLQKLKSRSNSMSNKYSENSNMENVNQQNNGKDNNVDEDFQKQKSRSDSMSTVDSEKSKDYNSSLKKSDPNLSHLEEYISNELNSHQKATFKLNPNLQCIQTIINNKYYLKNLKSMKGDDLFNFLENLQKMEASIISINKYSFEYDQDSFTNNHDIHSLKNRIDNLILEKIGKQKELSELNAHILDTAKLLKYSRTTFILNPNMQFIQKIVNNEVYLKNLKSMKGDDLFNFLENLQRTEALINMIKEKYISNIKLFKSQNIGDEQKLLTLNGDFAHNIRSLKKNINEKILKTLGETHIQI